MALLSAVGLRKSFGDVQAVAGVDLTVEPGEIFGLVGPDGAGKSTTMRLLVGVLDADAGHAAVAGVRIDREPEAARELLGYMPQQYSLYADLSVAENLRFFSDMYFVPKTERQQRLARLYEFSRLGPYADRRAGQLSGGMYKKLALMCNMIHTPRLLLLDEPTTGVDPLSRRELWEILYNFADEGVAIIVCTPYMDEAERCHRVGLMSGGRFLITDSPRAILEGFREQVFEVVTDELKAAGAALGQAEFVRRHYPVGEVLKVVCAEGTRAEPVREAFAAAGVAVTVEPVRPNFEDVFLSYKETGHDRG
jgi:ABC-2 type transport system ATP-binding protein